MLEEALQGKTIAILGVKSLLGKFLLKKVLTELNTIEKIILLSVEPIKKSH